MCIRDRYEFSPVFAYGLYGVICVLAALFVWKLSLIHILLMIIFAQLCYCIYYENYYNPFIMKNKKNNFYLMGVVFIAILGGLLFGYDTAVISGAEQALQKHLGLDAFWHGVTASSALIGCVIGSAFSGYFASGLGRRNSLRLAALLFFLSALGSYYPEFLFFSKGDTSFALILAFNFYRIIGGIGVGLASAVCPMYIAEIAPSEIRGKLVSCNQFAIIFGMLVVYFVNYMIKDGMPDEVLVSDGWRYMFGSEAVPAALFGILLFLVPEMCIRDSFRSDYEFLRCQMR